MSIKYLAVVAQKGRCTWENGTWLGHVAPNSGDTDVALASCPDLHVYLNSRGAQSWGLATVATTARYDRLDLK